MHFSQILLTSFSVVALASALPTDLRSNLEAREAARQSYHPLRRDPAHHSYQPLRREAIPIANAEAAAFNDYLESIPQLRRRSAAKAAGSSSSISKSKPGTGFNALKNQGCDGCVQSLVPPGIRNSVLNSVL
ncbi:hypothetical protein MMC11_003851 [Xylographa trunciseda]|nr:hypothetical protein [Xylographa trunciseda]